MDNSTDKLIAAKDNHLTTSRKTEQERTDEINLLIDYIREHQPISMWALAKVMGIPNTTLYYKIRDLEFAGVIYSKIILNEYNRAVRMIYANKKEQVQNEIKRQAEVSN